MSSCPGPLLSSPLPIVEEPRQHRLDLHLRLMHSCGEWRQVGIGARGRAGRGRAGCGQSVPTNQGIAILRFRYLPQPMLEQSMKAKVSAYYEICQSPGPPLPIFIWLSGFQDDCNGRCKSEQSDVCVVLGPGYVHLSHESLRRYPHLGSVSCRVLPHVAWENDHCVQRASSSLLGEPFVVGRNKEY